MVYYRKYRPQTIAHLDLDDVREKLTAILKSNNIPHAFLFTGSKGLGKTSSARILAKAINCESKKEGSIEPCNECATCLSITNGSHIDVIEIDAASNRGIDEIRDLREKVKFSPSSLKKKVYIIDEVHMLTTEAFNALLKTLEEPPEHVIFILATTELWKLPGTIVSRAFHVQFDKPCNEELIRSLKRIVDGEKIDVEEGVLEKICELADGAFRDAAKILEELSLSSDKGKITKGVLEKAYKTDSIDHEVKAFLKALSSKDVKEALGVVGRISQSGCDYKIVIENIVGVLREVMLVQAGVEEKKTELSFSQKEVEELLTLFQEAYKQVRFSVVPSLPLEILAVKYCISEKAVEEKPSKENTKEKGKEEVSEFIPKPRLQVEEESNGQTTFIASSGDIASGVLDNDSFLKSLIDKVKKDNFSIAGVLRSTKVNRLDGTEVEIITPFKFHGEKLKNDQVVQLLESTASQILGRNVRMVITVKGS